MPRYAIVLGPVIEALKGEIYLDALETDSRSRAIDLISYILHFRRIS